MLILSDCAMQFFFNYKNTKERHKSACITCIDLGSEMGGWGGRGGYIDPLKIQIFKIDTESYLEQALEPQVAKLSHRRALIIFHIIE